MSLKIVDFNEKYNNPIAVALGFFDCIHIGHAKLVNAVKHYAASHSDTQSALFTFCNDPSEFLGKSKEIYTFNDRASALDNLGLDVVIKAKFDFDFMSMSPDGFIAKLFEKNVKAIAVGSDYTFGKNAEGKVDDLRAICKKNEIELIVVPFETIDGQKLSTSYLKSLVQSGNVARLNKYLSEPYFMKGVVKHAKHNGTGLGFPTANIEINPNRMLICDGIYATVTIIDGKEYYSMTNVGAKPTFNDDSVSVETYVFDFDEDLYGKEIKIEFIERTRDIVKFSSRKQLHNRLIADEIQIRKILENRSEL